MTLSYEKARDVLEASMAKAKEMGVNLSIAVVDVVGNPVATARMTGTRAGATSFVSQGKAMASALWGVPSAELVERMARSNEIREHVHELYGHRLLFLEGALPLKEGDETVGAVAASGGNAEQDFAVATAGAEAFARQ